MNSRIVRITTIALCAVLLLGATLARPARADQPIPFTDDWQYVYELAYCENGLIIYDETFLEIEGRDWYDHDGNWIKYVLHFWQTDRLYTNQNDLKIQTRKFTGGQLAEYDARRDLFTINFHGNLFKVMLPGYGNIFHIVGHVDYTFDGTIMKVTPKMETYFEGDVTALCAYFAGQ